MGRFSSPLPPDVVTLPEVLRTLGYYAGVCGRYFHLDGLSKAWISGVTKSVYEKLGLQTWHRRVHYLDSSDQSQTTARFEECLSKAPKGRPWFMWINYLDPHHVWDADAGKVDPAKVRLRPHLPNLPGVRGDLARHLGEVERLDRTFEQNLAVLRKHGMEDNEDNTLIEFMGDNGMAFPHGEGSLYDSGLNVPLAVRWPGKIKPGRTRTLISGEDVAPTLIEAAGAKPLKKMTGRSFLGLLTGGANEPRTHIFGARLRHGNSPFTEKTKAAGFDLSHCVRSDHWELIYNCTPQMGYQPVDNSDQPSCKEMAAAHQAGTLDPKIDQAYFGRRPVLELYNLDKDPGELDNLAGRKEVAEIQQALLVALSEKMITD
jgi:arylsulfatase A-like enzyme